MIIMTYTAEEIKAIRKMAGMSARTIAQSIGITRQTYYNIENRETKLTGPMAISLTVAIDILCEEQGLDPKKVLEDYAVVKKISEKYVNKIDKELKEKDIKKSITLDVK